MEVLDVNYPKNFIKESLNCVMMNMSSAPFSLRGDKFETYF